MGKYLIGLVAHCIISRQLKDLQLCATEAVSSFTRQVNLPSAPSSCPHDVLLIPSREAVWELCREMLTLLPSRTSYSQGNERHSKGKN